MSPRSHRRLLFLGILALLAMPATWSADKAGNEPKVSITPRPKPSVEGDALPRSNIRVDTTLVLIPVTVTDPLNRFVTGLEKENFTSL